MGFENTFYERGSPHYEEATPISTPHVVNGNGASKAQGFRCKEVDLHYLELLSLQYPNREAAFSEIINLQAILHLPKGTENFVSDVHGEYEAFCHILNNCSGVIRDKVVELLHLEGRKLDEFCTLIYYPHEVMHDLDKEHQLTDEWFREQLALLIKLTKYLSAKYTRSKVRKAINRQYSYIIDELINAQAGEQNSRSLYHQKIIDTILHTNTARHFVNTLCALCKRLAVDHLHIVGDIFDRGPHPDRVMNLLMHHHSLDIQWGNHDALWMGAALGSPACVATVLRNNIKYDNFQALEGAYGISLRQINAFVEKVYLKAELARDPTWAQKAEQASANDKEYEQELAKLRHKLLVHALTVIALKLQGQVVMRNREFRMNDRLLLEKMDLEKGCIEINGQVYELNTTNFPTVDFAHPYELSEQEQEVMNGFIQSFRNSKELQAEVAFLYSHGSMYKCYNGNLLYHGCVPMTAEGGFREVNCHGQFLKGKDLMDYCDYMARHAFAHRDERSLDFMYFLWCGYHSPLSGRVMKPFERHYINDKSVHHEPRDAYYDFYHEESVCRRILHEFGLDPEHGHIINGHTPIRVKEGENPVRGGGKLIVIDGGLCSAYHKTTGIAGYTLVFSSHGMLLKSHKPFESTERAIKDKVDIVSDSTCLEQYPHRLLVANSDNGKRLMQTIYELEALLKAYREGKIIEKQSINHEDLH